MQSSTLNLITLYHSWKLTVKSNIYSQREKQYFKSLKILDNKNELN